MKYPTWFDPICSQEIPSPLPNDTWMQESLVKQTGFQYDMTVGRNVAIGLWLHDHLEGLLEQKRTLKNRDPQVM